MKKPGSKKQPNNSIISVFHKANCQKPLAEENKRTIHKLIRYGLLGVIIFGAIFELALEYIPGLILWPSYGCLVLFILKEMWDFIKENYKNSSEYKSLASSNQSVWCKMETSMRLIRRIVIRSTEVLIGTVLLVIITGGTAWAQFNVNERLFSAVEAFIAYQPTDDVENEPGLQTPMSTPDSENSGSNTNSEKSNDLFENVAPSLATEPSFTPSKPSTMIDPPDTNDHAILEESPEKAAQIEKARRMVLEIPTKDWTIPNNERAHFLFTSGKYAVSSNWTTVQAAVKLEAYIDEVISCQYPNYFDLMADQTLRNLVSEASDLDNILVSSREKDQIITVRLDAYALYGKASLARLLAEDFHCYALAFQYYNGDQATITSYYLQSVKWLFESLKYAENSSESQLAILTSLRYRYNDIMTYSEPKSEQWEQAKLLADALAEIIEEQKHQGETVSNH